MRLAQLLVLLARAGALPAESLHEKATLSSLVEGVAPDVPAVARRASPEHRRLVDAFIRMRDTREPPVRNHGRALPLRPVRPLDAMPAQTDANASLRRGQGR